LPSSRGRGDQLESAAEHDWPHHEWLGASLTQDDMGTLLRDLLDSDPMGRRPGGRLGEEGRSPCAWRLD
ncbi:MAG TPA: hypothetical protein VFC16_12375, partial [Nakamurella sp.]|nr:hypothetical protein [Nakamurella sp.]